MYAAPGGTIKTGPGIDPTGGSSQFMQQLQGINPMIGVDPTGGADKYMTMLENLQFQVDPNDPTYQWRQKETEKAVNQAAAARGMWSRHPAIPPDISKT